MTHSELRIIVTRVVEAPASAVFDLLSRPERHREFDGSGMVREAATAEPVTAAGERFVMTMHNPRWGDYRMHNHVVAFESGRRIGWQPAPEKRRDDPSGWAWIYELEALDEGATKVTLIYDWSQVADEELRRTFPVVSAESLERSLELLAAAVDAG